ncbi:MAG TPA: serine/threonine-protein kinase [Vicinamibacterales bacterium]|nr:serine/threonine-protein kinase [Vicinamibacterales bacterium]
MSIRRALEAQAGTADEVTMPPVSAVAVTGAGLTSMATAAGAQKRIGDGPFNPGDQVGPRYTVIRLLGAGGMGAVYHAFDHELGVGVAIKVIRPGAQSDATAARELEQRFKRELVLARQITHRYVVRIHDIGEIDGIKYLTMPFVDGETLAAMLRREGKLKIPRLISLATQVATGLAAAHEKGVVHRDLKPENIMIENDSGDALIMDFGIARSVEGGGTQTAAGSVVGTIAYMAPEQAQGQKVDGRADIYALGLIMYDCLVGHHRLQSADSSMSELLQRLTRAPIGPRQIDPNIPEALDQIVRRCLDPQPAARFQTSADLVKALDALTPDGHARTDVTAAVTAAPPPPSPPSKRPAWHLAAAAVMIVVAAIAGWVISNRARPDDTPREPISVLVSQFENRTGDPVFDGVLEQAIGLGLEGATFITAYPQRDALRSAAAIKAGSKLDESTARLVAVRDGIKVVVAGAIITQGSGYQLAVRAIDVPTSKDLASITQNVADKSGVLPAMSGMATRLRTELGDTAASRDAGRETFTTGSLDAARAYVLGQDLARAGRFNEAIAQYQDAVQRDPTFGRAYSGWATAAYYAGRPDEAEQLWKKSLALMERMTEREKYRTLGSYYLGPGNNDEQAVENYRMLVDTYPSDGPGLNNLAVAYFRVLDFKRAAEQGQRAAAVYPNSVNYRTNVALYAMYASDFPTAVAEANKAIAISQFDKAYLPIAIAALASGKYDEARAAYTEMAKVSSRGASIASMGRADVDMYLGRYAEAREELLRGAASDEAGQQLAPRALKLIALAELAAATGNQVEAQALASQALKLSSVDAVLVPAGRLFAAAGRDATPQVAALDKQIRKRGRAMAAVIRAEAALAARRPVDAIDQLIAARSLADLWLVRMMLGRAYVEHGRYAEAIAELEACEKRIGEAADIFLDDWPTFRHTVPVKYWLARAQQGLGQADAAKRNYEGYLQLRGEVTGDPLAADARKRIAQ